MELVALGLREAGASNGTADLVSLLVLVLLCQRVLTEFPPDARSVAWAHTAPTAAATIFGVQLAGLLVGWFLITEDDTEVALGAAGLGVLVAAGCAWMARRD